MPKMEYKVYTTNSSNVQEKLDFFGEEGWELVTVIFIKYDVTMYFKRAVAGRPKRVGGKDYTTKRADKKGWFDRKVKVDEPVEEPKDPAVNYPF